jgi:putative FmdB family regulatory protein
MPTYEYECQSCHQRVENVQKFADPDLTVCPNCGGELRKVFSAVGIVFKGSGFYKTDSRSSSSSVTPPAATPSAAPSPEKPASSPDKPVATPTPEKSAAKSAD